MIKDICSFAFLISPPQEGHSVCPSYDLLSSLQLLNRPSPSQSPCPLWPPEQIHGDPGVSASPRLSFSSLRSVLLAPLPALVLLPASCLQECFKHSRQLLKEKAAGRRQGLSNAAPVTSTHRAELYACIRHAAQVYFSITCLFKLPIAT